MSGSYNSSINSNIKNKDHTNSEDILLKKLDKINDRARDLTSMLKKQGIILDGITDEFRKGSHKIMKKRIRLMYKKSSNQA